MKFDLSDKRKLFLVIGAVILMGFSLSFLVRTSFGEDPYSFMNLSISSRLGWTLGNWQALLNILLLLLVLLIARHHIGIGTIANMFLVGYSYDFFTWIENQIMPVELTELWLRITIAVPALVLFILSASLYMTCDLGASPYDSLAFILYEQSVRLLKKRTVSFRIVRIFYDGLAVLVGYLLGQIPGLLTLIIALFLGPVIQWMSGLLKKYGIISQQL